MKARISAVLRLLCGHRWGFPRRRARWGEWRNVDVETCVWCGCERLAPVQFAGSMLAGARERRPAALVGEREAEA